MKQLQFLVLLVLDFLKIKINNKKVKCEKNAKNNIINRENQTMDTNLEYYIDEEEVVFPTFKEIFTKITNCDYLSYEVSFSVDNILNKFDKYQEFVNDKIALRKKYEKLYKAKFTTLYPNIVFRHFIYNFYYTYKRDLIKYPLINDELNEIYNEIDALFKNKYPNILEECVNYLSDIIDELNEVLEAKTSYSHTNLRYLYNLVNGNIFMEIFYKIDEKLKDILINKIKVSGYNNELKCFENVTLYYKNKVVFYSITHEDLFIINEN